MSGAPVLRGNMSPIVAESQFLDGWALARHMGVTDRPFMVNFDTHREPWSWRKDRFTPAQLADLWSTQLQRPDVNPDYPVGLYVHVPFCTHTCAFCRCFRLQVTGKSALDQYVDFLCAQIDFFAPVFKGKPIRYFSVGGGTPSILNPAQLSRLFDRIYHRFDVRPSPLTTLEMSAPTMLDGTLKALVNNGIPRISVGVQTLGGNIRSANQMFRLDPQWLQQRVHAARSLGLHCNLDLVLGLPDEPAESFVKGFRDLLAMRPSSVIVNILNTNYFERIKASDALRGRDTNSYLKHVGEGMAEAAAQAGFRVYPHSNTIEAIAFFSPEFDEVAHQNWPVLERLASGVLSVNVGTSVMAFGSICNLALLPDWLVGIHDESFQFDPNGIAYQTSRKEVFSLMYPRPEDLGAPFSPAEALVINRVASSLRALSSRVNVLVAHDELLVEFVDADQRDEIGRIFVKAKGAGRPCHRRVGPFEMSFNGDSTRTMKRVLKVLEEVIVKLLAESDITPPAR